MFGAEGLAGLLLSIVLLPLVLLLAPLAFVGKLLLRRPWWVEAWRGGALMRWRVPRWGEAGRVADEIAEAFRAGVRNPSPRGAERVNYWGPADLLERKDADDSFDTF